MKLGSAEDIAKLLRVRLDVPPKIVYAKSDVVEYFDVSIDVMLDNKYLSQSEEILKAVRKHTNKWNTQIDIIINRRGSDSFDDSSYGILWYAQHQEIFEGESYRITAKFKKPHEPKTCTIDGRVRIGDNLYNAPWEDPWMDTKKVKFVKGT